MHHLISRFRCLPLGVLALASAFSALIFASAAEARMTEAPPSFLSLKASGALTAPAELDRRVLSALDVSSFLAEDAARDPMRPGPLRFAAAREVSWTPANSGSWDRLADGSRLWRVRLASLEARSVSLAFTRFNLPPGAKLWLYDAAGERVEGAYTAADRTAQGELWTPLFEAEEVVVELLLPAGYAGSVAGVLEIGRLHHGYRTLTDITKQGACNIDVVCPQGDAWRDQIRAVGWYTVQGIGLCTGTLVNNTAQDLRPYFLSAEHCGVTPGNAGSMVVYWNFEAPNCGQLSGGSLADNQSGAIWRAADAGPPAAGSDMLLVELDDDPAAAFDVHFVGWDARGIAPLATVGIHHPNLDEKSISFDNNPLQIDSSEYWRVGAWEEGTTEGGSSGSCLFDANSGLCVGTLFGGFASCNDRNEPDFYGRMDAHWTGPSPTSRLRDWLDPGNTGQLTLQGRDPSTVSPPPPPPPPPPPVQECVESDTTACLLDGRFKIEVNWRNFQDQIGDGTIVPLASDRSVLFWFFRDDNYEMLVKIVDACAAAAPRYWFLAAAATNVEYDIVVTDVVAGKSRTYSNDLGTNAPAITDTSFFDTCP